MSEESRRPQVAPRLGATPEDYDTGEVSWGDAAGIADRAERADRWESTEVECDGELVRTTRQSYSLPTAYLEFNPESVNYEDDDEDKSRTRERHAP